MDISSLERTFNMPAQAVQVLGLTLINPVLQMPLTRITKDARRVQMFAQAVYAKASELAVTGALYLAAGNFESAKREFERAQLLYEDSTDLLGQAIDLAVQAVETVRRFQFPKDLFKIGQKKKELDRLEKASYELRESARSLAERHLLDEALLQELG